MRNFSFYLLMTCVGLSLSACGGREAVDPVDEYTEIQVVDGTAGASTSGIESEPEPSVTGLGSDDPSAGEDTEAEATLLSSRVVYFEFNSSLLTLEAEAIVQAHAQNLRSNSDIQVILEGHADERGTREYNLALGEDRARSVSNIFELQGISPDRIQIVSYGEERPVSLGNNESSWALNRRVEILYQ